MCPHTNICVLILASISSNASFPAYRNMLAFLPIFLYAGELALLSSELQLIKKLKELAALMPIFLALLALLPIEI